MHIGDITTSNLVRGFPERDSAQSRSEFGHHAVIPPGRPITELSDELNFNDLGPKDLAKAIKRAINDSIVHQLFSALSRTQQGLFDGYNDNPVALDSSSQTLSDTDLTENFSRSFEQSISQTVEFNLSIDDDNLSLDFSFSRVETTQFEFSDPATGIAFSASQTQTEAFSFELSIDFEQQEQADPLILDLDFDGFKFSPIEQNIQFDLNADSQIDSISNLQGADAFLAIDLNQNGQIDDGLELFGDAGGSLNGFIDLQRFDDNGDDIINAQDHIFEQLLLLQFSSSGEQQITKLIDQDIISLDLNAKEKNFDYEHGNSLTAVSNFTDNSGNQGLIGDFLLGIKR